MKKNSLETNENERKTQKCPLCLCERKVFEAVWRAFLGILNGARRIGGDGKIRKLAKKCATLPWGWRSAALSLREKEGLVAAIGAESPVPFLHFGVRMRGAFPSGNRRLEVAFSSRQSLAADSAKKEECLRKNSSFALRL